MVGRLVGNGKDNTLKLLTSELENINTSIETVSGCWRGGWLG